MRIIYTSNDQKQASILSNFLKAQEIDNQLETEANNDWGSSNYGIPTFRIWVIDEDAVEAALKWRDEFEQNPDDPKFKVENRIKKNLESLKDSLKEAPVEFGKIGLKTEQTVEGSKMGFVTLYILISCILLFLYSSGTAPEITKVPTNIPSAPLVFAPVQKTLIIDYPKAYELTDQLVSRFGLEKLENPKTLPPAAITLIGQIQQTPYWKGIYDKIVAYLQNEPARVEGGAPLFEKVRQGEVWRLVTPIFMHGSILHLAFNMLLFVILGKQIEKKIGPFKFVVLIIVSAIFSNTVQYIMSGADFLGISGVICAMIGFVFARQRLAAWEGYQFNSISLSSVVVFIMLMFALQLIALIVEVSFKHTFSAGIANAAHLSGLFIGLLLGRFNFFKIKQ